MDKTRIQTGCDSGGQGHERSRQSSSVSSGNGSVRYNDSKREGEMAKTMVGFQGYFEKQFQKDLDQLFSSLIN